MSENLNVCIRDVRASSTSFDFLMSLIISSMWSSAFLRPSKICSRSVARARSKLVRRFITSLRCERNSERSALSESVCGTPWTSATVLKWNVSSSGVCLYRKLSTFSWKLSCLRSITMRTSLVDSSRSPLMPSTFFSRTKSAIRTMSSAFILNDFSHAARDDAALPGGVRVVHVLRAEHDSSRREIGALNESEKVFRRRVFIVNEVHRGGYDLAEVMRRNVGRHADGDAERSVQEQIGRSGGKHNGFPASAVKIWPQINRILFNVGEHISRKTRHFRLGIAVRGGRVAVERVVHKHSCGKREIMRIVNGQVAHIFTLLQLLNRHNFVIRHN